MIGQRVFYVRIVLVFPADRTVRVLEPLALPTGIAVRVLGSSVECEVEANRLHSRDGRHYCRVAA